MMDIYECAEALRFKGYTVFCWKPGEGTAEPDLVAMKNGRLYNVYLRKDKDREPQINSYAESRGARVLYLS